MKVCFIGLGSIGIRHLKNLKKISDEKSENLIVHALRHSSSFQHNELVNKNLYNYNQMDNDYDICFITNPTCYHFDAIRQTKGKSKFYFVEKPVFESTNYNIDDLRNESDKYYIACPLRYTKVFQNIQKIIKTENIISANARSSSYLPDWRPGIDYRDCYSAHEAMGGGVDIDLIHELDYICELFGMPVEEYVCTNKISDLEIDSYDYAGYLLKYKDKMVEIHLDYYSRKTVRFIELITNQSNYFCDFINMKITELNSNKVIDCYENSNDFYIKELNNFLLTMKKRKINSSNLEHAFEILKLAKGEI